MLTAIAVAIAGSLGALARYGVEGLVSRHTSTAFPWGTFAVNVTGSFALAVVFVLAVERLGMAPWARSAVTIGFLGAYTTFSTFSFETYRMIEDGALALAAANVAASVAFGLAAVYAGVVVARAI